MLCLRTSKYSGLTLEWTDEIGEINSSELTCDGFIGLDYEVEADAHIINSKSSNYKIELEVNVSTFCYCLSINRKNEYKVIIRIDTENKPSIEYKDGVVEMADVEVFEDNLHGKKYVMTIES